MCIVLSLRRRAIPQIQAPQCKKKIKKSIFILLLQPAWRVFPSPCSAATTQTSRFGGCCRDNQFLPFIAEQRLMKNTSPHCGDHLLIRLCLQLLPNTPSGCESALTRVRLQETPKGIIWLAVCFCFPALCFILSSSLWLLGDFKISNSEELSWF